MKLEKNMELNFVSFIDYEFENLYEKLEKDNDIKLKKVLSAKELFKSIMKTQLETGNAIYLL